MLMFYMKKDGCYNETEQTRTRQQRQKIGCQKNTQFLHWTPSSADLSPNENVWQILKNEVAKKIRKIFPISGKKFKKVDIRKTNLLCGEQCGKCNLGAPGFSITSHDNHWASSFPLRDITYRPEVDTDYTF